MGGRHRQPVGSRKGNDRLIISLGRSELRRELFRRQVPVIIRAGRVIELPEQPASAAWLRKGSSDRQMQRRRALQPLDGLRPATAAGT